MFANTKLGSGTKPCTGGGEGLAIRSPNGLRKQTERLRRPNHPKLSAGKKKQNMAVKRVPHTFT